ncbi:MAG: ATP-dependent sacrificial sulfur transferase LarE [Anaerovoracaceae bacterium]|nr:ATP-dependent sacrificial sulfur transferase LarE [Anaerovoracaceae bacterium]
MNIQKKLESFFKENSKAAIAFSGGVDSAYLLYAALETGAQVRAYYVKSCFQPQFELDDALQLAEELNADMTVLQADVLSVPEIRNNPADRCYYCKQKIFGTIIEAACNDGFSLILDGTNASDDASDRPGMAALEELSVRSPLRECGLTKAEIRRLSKEAGLFTWDKPAYACLATRIPAGEEITLDKLEKTEKAEAYLMSLGFVDFRVRQYNRFLSGSRQTDEVTALLQVRAEQIPLVLEKRSDIISELKKYYGSVTLDLCPRV